MITPNELAAELTRRGFPTSKRAVRDWYSTKGLIPKPEPIGQGPRRGVKRGWCNADIVDQATLVASVLAIHSDTATALVVVWLMGYEVDLRKLRAAWRREHQTIKNQSERPDIAHQINTYSIDARRKIKRLRGISIDLTTVKELAQPLLNPRDLPNAEQRSEILVGLATALGIDAAKIDETDEAQFANLVEALPRIFDRELIETKVARASHPALRRAHKNWIGITELLRSLFPTVFAKSSGNHMSISDQYIIWIGRLLIPQLILAGEANRIEEIEKLIQAASTQLSSTPIDKSKDNQIANLRSIFMSIINLIIFHSDQKQV